MQPLYLPPMFPVIFSSALPAYRVLAHRVRAYAGGGRHGKRSYRARSLVPRHALTGPVAPAHDGVAARLGGAAVRGLRRVTGAAVCGVSFVA